MLLTRDDEAILEGNRGEASQIALSILVEWGELYGAEGMIAISQAHCDTGYFVSDAQLEVVERLADLGGEVAVPTSINPSLIDLKRWKEYRAPTDVSEKCLRLERAHQKMKVAPTWTCTPYQAGLIPRFGEQIAWAESNAIYFANSVIGARTNRYATMVELFAALVGRVPRFGLHVDQNRKAEAVIRLVGFTDKMFHDGALYPLLGFLIGEIAGDRVVAVEGLPRTVKTDCLKTFSAGMGTSGSSGMYHVVGVTPEAQTVDMCLHGVPAREVIEARPKMIQDLRQRVLPPNPNNVDLVALGCPHFSFGEFRELDRLMHGKRVRDSIGFWVFTSRAVYGWIENSGMVERLKKSGVTIFTDGCPLMIPHEPWGIHAIMTNSVKLAYYGYSQIGLHPTYGSLEDCVNMATGEKTAGRLFSWEE